MERSEIPMQTMWPEHSLKEVPLDRQQEFQQFYQENLGLIYRHVYNQVGIREEAEDLTSQIFLKALPEKYREVLKCRFLLKLSVKATALKLGVTEANVKVMQFRALKRATNLEQVVAEQ